MMKKVWRGSLGPLMEKHLHLREAVGRVNTADANTLFGLNELVLKKYPKVKTLSRVIILDYLSTKKNLSASGRRLKVIHIRQFCRFLLQRGIACYMPDRTLMTKYQYKPRYCVLTEKQVLDFMKNVRAMQFSTPFNGETYAVILALLWCTGLRRREVINLQHKDVDLKNGILLIRETKFRKDRIIPLSPSVKRELKKYKSLKINFKCAVDLNAWFFTTPDGKPICGHTLSEMFNRLVKKMNIQNNEGRVATLHDFRHNFATQNMARFFRDPEKYPPSAYMARLSTYLGHVSLLFTQYYLHPDFNLMQEASEKFKLRQT